MLKIICWNLFASTISFVDNICNWFLCCEERSVLHPVGWQGIFLIDFAGVWKRARKRDMSTLSFLPLTQFWRTCWSIDLATHVITLNISYWRNPFLTNLQILRSRTGLNHPRLIQINRNIRGTDQISVLLLINLLHLLQVLRCLGLLTLAKSKMPGRLAYPAFPDLIVHSTKSELPCPWFLKFSHAFGGTLLFDGIDPGLSFSLFILFHFNIQSLFKFQI